MTDTSHLSSGDADKLRSLRTMKRFATSLLVVAAVVYLIARWAEEHNDTWGYLRAFAEAAMVGALADWFAVTALFRHPLGIPIPHTAIIPKRKDQIGRSLGEFVQDNFLTEAVLRERLAGAHVGQRLGTWLADEPNAKRAGEAVSDALRGTLEVLDDRDIGTAFEGLVERRVLATPVAPLVGRAIDVAIDGGHQQRLLDAVMSGLRGFLDDNRSTLRARLENESPWWIPERIDDRIFGKIYDGVHRFIADVAADEHHEVRTAIDVRLASFADRLRDDPGLLAKGEELKREVLAHPEVRAWLRSLWRDLKSSMLTASADPTSELRRRIDSSLQTLGSRLRDDVELQAKVDAWVTSAAGYVVQHYRGEVAELISSTVQKWDGKATSERMELQVGRDLQFIRINGTIVGGLAGLVIFSVSRLLL